MPTLSKSLNLSVLELAGCAMSKRELGVVIARFQAPDLTPAHIYLLSQVTTRSDRVLVLLGVAPVPLARRNPLDFTMRRQMLTDWWASFGWEKELDILPLYDCPSNEEWAANVDMSIDLISMGGKATLYCGPDGAGPIYSASGGKWPIDILDSVGGHASKLRYGLEPRRSEDFRAGVIYAVERQFNMPRAVVDVIIRDGTKVLLGQKHIDGDKWRLIGGFVDATDSSLEAAVRREAREETGLEISEPMYVGSAIVDDWRFRSGPEVVLSSVFYVQKLWGDPVASDDIDRLRWFEASAVEAALHQVHSHLWEMAQKVQ